MSVQSIISQIDRLRSQRFLTVSSKNHKTSLQDQPVAKCYGLYWLYASYTFAEIANASKAPTKGAVDIPELAQNRQDLAHVCRVNVDGFTLVYNGIGGVGPKGTGGLRERILQEFSGGEGTGSLAISKSSLSDLSKWRYSYVTLSHPNVSSADFDWLYEQWAEKLEMAWRLEYGWPILCAK